MLSYLSLFCLLLQHLLSSLSCHLEQPLRLQPAFCEVELLLDFKKHSLVLAERHDDIVAEPFEVLDLEATEVFAVVKAMEGVLESEAVGHFEVLPDNHSSSSKLALLHFELAGSDVNHMVQTRENSREQPHSSPRAETTIRCSVATVDERVGFPRVAMEVAVQQDTSLFLEFPEHGLRVENSWVEKLTRSNPLPVQVNPCKRGPVVASHNSVGIQARDKSEQVVFSESLCYRIIWIKQGLQKSLEHKTSIGFSWMHPTCNDDSFALFVLLSFVLDSCHSNHRDRQSRQGQAKEFSAVCEVVINCDFHLLPELCTFRYLLLVHFEVSSHHGVLKFENICDHLSKLVWTRVSYEYGVLIVIEIKRELQTVIRCAVCDLL